VWHRSRPEGSIAEAYVADECLTFSSKYLDDVDTRFNREPRNMGFLMKKPMVLMISGTLGTTYHELGGKEQGG
jgi:hypothetical protein